MAQNYNLNPNFGLNVTHQAGHKTTEISPAAQRISSMFEDVDSAINKYDSVFSGDVEKQISMYSRQAMIVGMNLRAADSNVRKFDTSI